MKKRWFVPVMLSALLAGSNVGAQETQTVETSVPGAEQTVFIATGTSNKGLFTSRVGWGLRSSRFGIGVEVGGGLANDLAIEGLVEEEGIRFRSRVPLIARFDGGTRMAADLVVAPGLRYIEGEGRSATAITTDLAFIGYFSIAPTLAIHTGIILPFAFDITGNRELAMFPGSGWMLGTEFAVTRNISLFAQGSLIAPEGYGGDGAKSVTEATLSIRYHWAEAGLSGWIHLPESL